MPIAPHRRSRLPFVVNLAKRSEQFIQPRIIQMITDKIVVLWQLLSSLWQVWLRARWLPNNRILPSHLFFCCSRVQKVDGIRIMQLKIHFFSVHCLKFFRVTNSRSSFKCWVVIRVWDKINANTGTRSPVVFRSADLLCSSHNSQHQTPTLANSSAWVSPNSIRKKLLAFAQDAIKTP